MSNQWQACWSFLFAWTKVPSPLVCAKHSGELAAPLVTGTGGGDGGDGGDGDGGDGVTVVDILMVMTVMTELFSFSMAAACPKGFPSLHGPSKTGPWRFLGTWGIRK